MALGAG
jgi:uncharacterized protein YciI